MNKLVLAFLTICALFIGVATYFILFVDPSTVPAWIGGPLAAVQDKLAGVIIWLQGAWTYVITTISAVGGGVGLFNAYKTKQIAAQQVGATQLQASGEISKAYNIAGTAQTKVNTLTEKVDKLTADLEATKKVATESAIFKQKYEGLAKQKSEIEMALRVVQSPTENEMIRRLEQVGYSVRKLVA